MLEIKGLTKKYNQTSIIKDLTLSIQKGEKVCLFAPSGTGKTTLIKIINGLIKKYSGIVNNNFQNISTIFQNPNLFWYKTVKQNILFPLKIKNIHFSKNISQSYNKWLEITELTNKENSFPGELSGGMRQKVALIRGFLFNPSLILLDEPFSSIDIRAKDKIINFILEEYAESTLLFVTHTIEDIPKLANKIFLFSRDMLSGYKEVSFNKSDKPAMIIKNIYEAIY